MSELDGHVVTMLRTAALALAPDLVERVNVLELKVCVEEPRAGGILVQAKTRREAWTQALEAAQRRAAWRVRLVERRLRLESAGPPASPEGAS